MSISMYQASIPQFSKMLTNLSHILKKGEEFASAKSLDSKALVEGRLAPDMFPLTKQVQIACDQVKNGMARIAGVEPPKFEDDEASFADLQERIAKTIISGQSRLMVLKQKKLSSPLKSGSLSLSVNNIF